jgi:predicted nucleic acid-binding protein
VNGFLLDTNVVSELRKRERCAPKVSAWTSTVPPNQDFLSVLVVGELRRGAILKRRRDPAAADALEKWIARLVHNGKYYCLKWGSITVDRWFCALPASAFKVLP